MTSYAELVLAPLATDIAHPAFAKMFVVTDYLPELGVIIATRRRRTPQDPEVWAAHIAVVETGKMSRRSGSRPTAPVHRTRPQHRQSGNGRRAIVGDDRHCP